jgi:hypothetical protein
MIARGAIADLPRVDDVLGSAAAECFPLPAGMTGYAVPDPGKSLSPSRQEHVFAALVRVTTRSFEADMTPYWAHRRQERYFHLLSEFVLVADAHGRMVGWTGYQTFAPNGFRNIYIDSTGMVSSDQSRGVMRTVFTERIGRAAVPRLARSGARVYVSARSESPVFYKLMRSLVEPDGLFPRPARGIPPDVEACVRDLAQRLGQIDILEPSSLVLRNAYGSILDELYGELPSCGEPDLDRLFRTQLGPLDAYLLVGRAERRPEA